MDPRCIVDSDSDVRNKRISTRRSSQKQIDPESDEPIVTLISKAPSPQPGTPSSPTSSGGILDTVRNMPIFNSITYFMRNDSGQTTTTNTDQQPSDDCGPTTTPTNTSQEVNKRAASFIDLSTDDDDNAVEIIDIKPGKRRKTIQRQNSTSVHLIHPDMLASPPSIVDISDSPTPLASGSKSNLDTSPLIIPSTEIFNHPPSPAAPPPLSNLRIIKCPICLEEESKIQASGDHLVVTTCGHVYCKNCIAQAIKNSRQCPKCRKRLSAKSYHPIYI